MILVYLMFLHFVADFILQSREMGQKKSTEWEWMKKHIFWIKLVFFVGLFPVVGFYKAATFALANGLIHLCIDSCIWKVYAWTVWERERKTGVKREDLKKRWKYWEDKWFYDTIGLDQFLHVATIIIIWSLLGG